MMNDLDQGGERPPASFHEKPVLQLYTFFSATLTTPEQSQNADNEHPTL